MYEELIKVLRQYRLGSNSIERCMGVMDTAADAILALQAENAEMCKEIWRMKDITVSQRTGLRQLRDKLTRVEQARDAVVRDLGYQDGSMCNYCQQDGDCDVTAQVYLKNKGSCFKWRGLRGMGE